MSEQNGTAPAGWYPDANAPGGQRWWDGTRWAEQTAAPYRPVEPLTAPAGTDANTVWIWLVVLLPLLALPTLFLFDVTGYMRQMVANPSSVSSALAIFTPGYFIAILLGWASTAAGIVFSWLDWRTLKQRGVPAPFHWAFAFLVFVSAGIVYPIGRSVVVKRRTGSGLAPMVVAIVVYAVLIIASFVWVAVIMSQMFAMMPSYVYS